jgi:hypothetical protein
MISHDLQKCQETAFRLIAALSRIGGEHKDDLAAVVDFIEKAVHSDPIAPGLRPIAFEFFDIAAEKRLLTELWINIVSQLGDDLLAMGAEI